MQPNKTHLPSLLTFIALALGALFLAAIAGITTIAAMMNMSNGSSGAAEMIISVAFGVEATLLAYCAYVVLQKVRGVEAAEQPFKSPFFEWHIVAGVAILLVGALVGTAVAMSAGVGLTLLIMPTLTVLMVITPLWILFNIGANRIEAGPRWRFFAILGLSLTIAPLSMIVLEILTAGVILIGGAVFISVTSPELITELANTLQFVRERPQDLAFALEVFSPYLTHPAVVISAFGFIAVLVPLIEELLKPLAVWLFASTLDSPAQGFLFGALSGAAFALFESLNASADVSTTWAVILGGRIGTGILHITASALVGLGIGYAFKEKRYGLLLACYGAAVFAHSLWNASAMGLAFTGLGQLTGNDEWLVLSPFLLCNLVALGMIFLAVLVASNRKLQNAATAPVEVEAVTEQQPDNN